MKTAIVYFSRHHGNTKKLLDADLSAFERIGLASGIYFSSFAKPLIAFAEAHLPENREVFYLYTHGARPAAF